MNILVHKNRTKMVLPDTLPYLKIYHNTFAAHALENLTALSRTSSWTWLSLLGGEGKGRIREGRKEKGGYGREEGN